MGAIKLPVDGKKLVIRRPIKKKLYKKWGPKKTFSGTEGILGLFINYATH